MTATTTKNGKGVNLSDRENFKVHLQENTNRPFISKPVLGRVSKKWTMQMTRRLNHRDGSFAGVVVVSVDPAYFTDYYNKADLGEKGVLGLLGQDGVFRARRSGDVTSTGLRQARRSTGAGDAG